MMVSLPPLLSPPTHTESTASGVVSNSIETVPLLFSETCASRLHLSKAKDLTMAHKALHGVYPGASLISPPSPLPVTLLQPPWPPGCSSIPQILHVWSCLMAFAFAVSSTRNPLSPGSARMSAFHIARSPPMSPALEGLS